MSTTLMKALRILLLCALVCLGTSGTIIVRGPVLSPAAGGGGDPSFADVTLLLHFDGSDGSTSFPDNSSLAHTATAQADAQVDTAIKKYGTGALLMDGSGDYVSVPYVQADFDWWTEDYTVEMWVYPVDLSKWEDPTNQASGAIGNKRPGNAINYWSFGPITNGTVRFYYFNGSPTAVTSSETVPTNAWSHIAMTKNASGIRIWVNGVGNSNTAVSGTPLSSESEVLSIGATNSIYADGSIDDIRIKKGVAIYTADFTPPASPHPDS